jgi:hypothetical protein
MATLATLSSASLDDDRSFHVPTVRIRKLDMGQELTPRNFIYPLTGTFQVAFHSFWLVNFW